jgi:LuxR family maltose regulon positive regulatory protein
MWQAGQTTLLLRWLAQLTPADIAGMPSLAVGGAWVYLLTGHAEQAEALAAIVDRVPDAGVGAGQPEFLMSRQVLRSIMGRYGPAETIKQATEALRHPATPPTWRGGAAVLLGLVHLGEPGGTRTADALAVEALAGAAASAHGVRMGAHTVRALAQLQVNRLDDAWAHATLAREVLAGARDPGSLSALLVLAADARIRGLRGDLDGARETLVQAQLIRSVASHVSPWLSVPPLIELTHAYLVLSDPGGAQTVLRQAEDIVRRRPALGGYVDQILQLRRRLLDASDVLAGSSTLTNAELRVLPLLPTYLSFEEIGERLNVSRNTVKTHAMSIYGKLWASSRSEAVERAVELGLLEPYPALARHRGTDAGS